MKKDNFKTDVIFRKEKSGDFIGIVYALFPYCLADLNGNVMSYQHIGQHSAAEYNFCILKSVPANETEYKDLKKELESIGYDLNIVKKQVYSKWLNELNNMRKK